MRVLELGCMSTPPRVWCPQSTHSYPGNSLWHQTSKFAPGGSGSKLVLLLGERGGRADAGGGRVACATDDSFSIQS